MNIKMNRKIIGVDEVGRGCERPDAEVLTLQGWKFYTDISTSDKVMSLTKDGEIFWQPIIKILEFKFNGELVELKNKSLHAVVTPDHGFDVLSRISKRFLKEKVKEKVIGYKLIRKNVNELKDNDYIPRGGIWTGKTSDYFILPPTIRSKHDTGSINLSRCVPMGDWLCFLGLYIAEGCCIKPYKGSYRIHISQTKEKNMKRIDQILSKLPINFKRVTNGFVAHDKGLHAYLSRLGNVYTKYIPQEFKNLSISHLKSLWEGLCLGDGNIYNPLNQNKQTQITYYTSSALLKDDVEEILIKLGYSFRTFSRINIDGQIKSTCPNYKIRLKRSIKTAVKFLKVSYLPYSGKVFCLSLPKYHNFLVRRSGSAYFTGNSLAGPVVCAAVILPAEQRPWVAQIRDSKKLSPKKRQLLAEYITEECVYAIREGSTRHIESVNILNSTLWTMKKCVDSVVIQGGPVDLVLVDGNREIPGITLPQQAIKGGDDIHKAIGAASIIAKVYRDNYMIGMDYTYPEYGFAKHKGYGTVEHREAIMMYGPCHIHRMTFKGVYEYVKGENII